MEQDAPSNPSTSYHVYLSFRPQDSGHTFTDHLHRSLVGAGFRVYKCDDEYYADGEEETRDDFKSKLKKGIEKSRMSVIVLSREYASSEKCLDELVMILERKRKSGHIVLPVFFDVDPSDVRKQTGCFGEPFSVKEEDLKIRDWRTALKELADLGGMPLQNQADGYEAKFIENIVEVVVNKLRPRALNSDPYLVAINHRTEDVILWLQDRSTNVGLYVICGIGGIGKTTIAKFAYNSTAKSFEGSSFLANISEIAKQCNGLVRLQKQLIYDIVGQKERISNVDEGIMMIEGALYSKRILLVLDDVNEVDQIDTILGMRGWLHPSSKIIITTRLDSLLKPCVPHKVLKVEALNKFDSLQFFSRHAFGEDHPLEGYLELSERVVLQCAGLPLALRVLGSALSGRRPEIWGSALEKLEAIPHSHVIEKLKLSFDSLEDDHDRNIFLHIALFFLGMDRDDSVRILDGCGFHAIIGMQNLIDRSLLTINDLNKLEMHQLLRDMGRDIVRRESHDPGKRSRLWNTKDSFIVLNNKTGTERIEGISIDMAMLMEDRSAKRFFTANSSKSTGTDAFTIMRNLRVLKLNGVNLIGCYKEFPKRLKWLSWRKCRLKSLPSDFSWESLVSIDMRYSSLKQTWSGTEGTFKLEGLEDADPQMLKHFGLNVESMESSMVKMECYFSNKMKMLPLQGLYEHGVFSTFLPGNKVPSWFTKLKKTNGVSFTISKHVKNIQGLSIGIVYTSSESQNKRAYWINNQNIIHNMSKDLKWRHSPIVFGVPEGNEEMTWLSHWKFGDLLQDGDDISILVELNGRLKVEELGIDLVRDPSNYCKVAAMFSNDKVPGDVSQRGRKFKIGR